MKRKLLILPLLLLLTGCSFFGNNNVYNGPVDNGPKSVVVHYFDGKSMTYEYYKNDRTIETNFISPSGKMISGLYDENDIQYASYDCKIDLKNNAVIPSDLYAKYEQVDVNFYDESYIWADEDPKLISFYTGRQLTYTLKPNEDIVDKKIVYACLNNPYADITVNVSFYGKDNGTPSSGNEFRSKFILNEDTVGSISMNSFGSSTEYQKFSYTANFKAKQYTNCDYQFKIYVGASLGYKDYYVKNFYTTFKFSFDDDNNS